MQLASSLLEIQRYKYRINVRMIEMFGNESARAKAKQKLFNQYGINPHTFKRDSSILLGETEEIAEERMAVYAVFFRCTVDYLQADYIAFKKRLGI